jgi:hypothetical protein
MFEKTEVLEGAPYLMGVARGAAGVFVYETSTWN